MQLLYSKSPKNLTELLIQFLDSCYSILPAQIVLKNILRKSDITAFLHERPQKFSLGISLDNCRPHRPENSDKETGFRCPKRNIYILSLQCPTKIYQWLELLPGV